VDRGG